MEWGLGFEIRWIVCHSSVGATYTCEAHVYEPWILNTKDELTFAVMKQVKQL